jgi:Ca2+-binding EF-hand superfamily protein
MKVAIPFACLLLAYAPCGTLLAQSTHSELKPIAFSTLDTNKDGKISPSEARADPDLYAAFDTLDLNHDGFLSPQEFQAWPRAMKTKDASSPDPATAPGGSAGAQHMPAP